MVDLAESVVLLPGAWRDPHHGMGRLLAAYILRAVLAVVALVAGSTPLGHFAPLQLLFDLGLCASSLLFLVGMIHVRRFPLRSFGYLPAQLAFTFSCLLVLLDLAAALTRWAAPPLHTPLLLATSLATALTWGLVLIVLLRLAPVLQVPSQRRRAERAILLLIALTFVALLGFGFATSPISDDHVVVAPLAVLGFVLGLALSVGSLWLLVDAREAMLDRPHRAPPRDAP